MSVTVKVLINAKQVENAQTSQYVATNVKTIIDKFTATNTTAGAVTLSVNIIPSGGSAGSDNLIIQTKSIGAGQTYTFPELVGQYLEDGSIISTIASAASSLTLRCSGREIA